MASSSSSSSSSSLTTQAAPAQNNAKKEEAPNEYIKLINKKIRSLTKKLNNSLAIEKKVEAGGSINAEQQQVLANKNNFLKALKEYEDLRSQMEKHHQEEEKQLKKLQKRNNTQASKDQLLLQKQDLAPLIQLLQTSAAFEDMTLRKRFLQQKRTGESVVNSDDDFEALVKLRECIVNSAAIDMAVEHAFRFVTKSREEATQGLSYQQIFERLSEISSAQLPEMEQAEEKGQELQDPQTSSAVSEDLPQSEPISEEESVTPSGVASDVSEEQAGERILSDEGRGREKRFKRSNQRRGRGRGNRYNGNQGEERSEGRSEGRNEGRNEGRGEGRSEGRSEGRGRGGRGGRGGAGRGKQAHSNNSAKQAQV